MGVVVASVITTGVAIGVGVGLTVFTGVDFGTGVAVGHTQLVEVAQSGFLQTPEVSPFAMKQKRFTLQL